MSGVLSTAVNNNALKTALRPIAAQAVADGVIATTPGRELLKLNRTTVQRWCNAPNTYALEGVDE